MANKTINDLTTQTAIVGTDYLPYWDVSAVATRKVTPNYINLILLGQGNTFTAGQIFAPTSTSDTGFTVNMPAGTTASAYIARMGGTLRSLSLFSDVTGYLHITDYDYGAGAAGSYVEVGRNTNASNGAGFIRMRARGSTTYRIWPDTAGQLRIHTADPTNANDVAGTVVGTQVSMADAKNLLGEVGDPREALKSIIDAAKNGLRRFNYKSGAFNNQEFEGIVTDLAPRYGLDRDEEHPTGKSLNEIQLFADLIQAVAYLAEKIEGK